MLAIEVIEVDAAGTMSLAANCDRPRLFPG
jgi:hypothetical protein